MQRTCSNKPLSAWTRFLRGTEGSVNIEAIMFFPLLVALITATMVLYDAIRQDMLVTKANYAIADAVSRETSEVSADYITGLGSATAMLTNRMEDDVSLRVSVVRFDAEENSHVVEWSRQAGTGFVAFPEGTGFELASALPPMSNAERLIYVETEMGYDWPIRIGLDDFSIRATSFTRPRFAPTVAVER